MTSNIQHNWSIPTTSNIDSNKVGTSVENKIEARAVPFRCFNYHYVVNGPTWSERYNCIHTSGNCPIRPGRAVYNVTSVVETSEGYCSCLDFVRHRGAYLVYNVEFAYNMRAYDWKTSPR